MESIAREIGNMARATDELTAAVAELAATRPQRRDRMIYMDPTYGDHDHRKTVTPDARRHIQDLDLSGDPPITVDAYLRVLKAIAADLDSADRDIRAARISIEDIA